LLSLLSQTGPFVWSDEHPKPEQFSKPTTSVPQFGVTRDGIEVVQRTHLGLIKDADRTTSTTSTSDTKWAGLVNGLKELRQVKSYLIITSLQALRGVIAHIPDGLLGHRGQRIGR
jgi:hypothetical protein